MIRRVFNILLFPFKIVSLVFYNICLYISRGFYFYFYLFFSILSKLFPIKAFKKCKDFFKKIQDVPMSIVVLVIIFFGIVLFIKYGETSNDDMVYVKDDSLYEVTEDYGSETESDKINELNLYRYFGSYKLSNINFNSLKRMNSNTVAWIIVDNTNINYPVVQSKDNDYYLSHDFNNDYSLGGWVFMDYRNNSLMDEDNTIFYGHNLLNKTSFGSLVNLFDDNWFNKSNHKILVLTDKGMFTYQIFSVYIVEPESYYLSIYLNDNLESFLDTLKSRSVYDFNVELNSNDRIITLSTCTEDNKGRRVVHAKLVN